MNPKIFFGELKRRNVYKVAVAYAVVGWLLIQVATQVFPFLEIPNWMIRLVILLTAFGFPVALILAWAYDITARGIQITPQTPIRQFPCWKHGRGDLNQEPRGDDVSGGDAINLSALQFLKEPAHNIYGSITTIV